MSRLFITIVIGFFTITAFGQDAGSARDLDASGHRRMAKGDYKGAIADFTQVIELTSRLATKSGSLRNNLLPGASYDENHFSDEVRAIDPRTAFAYLNRGNAFFATGDP